MKYAFQVFIFSFLILLVACTAEPKISASPPSGAEKEVVQNCGYWLQHRDDISIGPDKDNTEAYKYNACVQERIATERDPALCGLLLQTYWGSNPAYDGMDCVYNLLKAGAGKGYCDAHPITGVNSYGNKEQDLCYYYEAEGQNDSSICAKIGGEQLRVNCVLDASIASAVKSYDFATCARLAQQEWRDQCFNKLSLFVEDPRACDKTAQREKCLTLKSSFNAAVCVNIVDSGIKNRCEWLLSRQ